MDLVIAWCSFSEERMKKISDWKERLGIIENDGNNPQRYQDHNELKYALRSIEKNLSGVTRVILVTDNERPEWLVKDTDFLKVVDHKEIIPKEYLPTFNSDVIEAFLYNIPGLSENFLYANDDMFVSQPLDVATYFFNAEGKPIYRVFPHTSEEILKARDYGLHLILNYKLINNLYGKRYKYKPSHGIDAYNKTAFKNIVENSRLAPFIKDGLKHKFRESHSVGRPGISLAMVAEGKMELRVMPVKKPAGFSFSKIKRAVDKLFNRGKYKKVIYLAEINNFEAYRLMRKWPQFCINDNLNAGAIHYRFFEYKLNEWFPKKSKYEK